MKGIRPTAAATPLAALGAAGLILGIAAAAGDTTGTVTACATVSAPPHTAAGDGGDVHTMPGDSATRCETVTQTVTVSPPPAPPPPPAGTTFYVSETGSDMNPGSDALPFRTIQRGLNVARPGETVVVKPGSYGPASFVRSGTARAPITLKAEYPAATSAASQHAALTSPAFGAGNGLRIGGYDHLVIDGFVASGFHAGIRLGGGADHNVVRNNVSYGNDSSGILLYGGSHNSFERNQLLDRGPPYPEAGAVQDYGIALYNGVGNRVTHNYFFGKHNQTLSLKEQVDSTYVGYNAFEGAMITALYLGQNDDNTANGAPGGDTTSSGATVEHNVFRDAADTSGAYYRLNSPITIRNIQNVVVRRNYIENHLIYAIWVKPGTGSIVAGRAPTGAKIYGNTIVNHRRADPHAGGGSAPKAIRIEGRGGEGATGDLIEIYNNSVYDTNVALSVVDGSSGQTLLVKNNNFVRAGSSGAEGDLSRTTLGHNNWWPQASVHGASDKSVDPLMVGPFTLHDPFANPGPSPVYDAASNRLAYKLRPGSPLIDAGTDVGLSYIGDAADIGANEFVP